MDCEGGTSRKDVIGRSSSVGNDEGPRNGDESEGSQQRYSEGGPSHGSARIGRSTSVSVGPPENADGGDGYNLRSDDITKHSRSHFFGVRRTFKHNEGKFEPFFAECHKPKEIKGISKKIHIWGFKTDVEAAVAVCVLVHVFNTYLESRKASYTFNARTAGGAVLRCHSALVMMVSEEEEEEEEEGEYAWLPDCTSDNELSKFCRKCVAKFRKIATSVKNGESKMPRDRGLADAVNRYLSSSGACQSFDQLYPSDRVPPPRRERPYLDRVPLVRLS